MHYEHAREYVGTRPDLISKLTGKPRPSPYHQGLTFIYSSKQHPDSLPMIGDQFPAVPWLKLTPKTRRMLIAQCQILPESGPLSSNLLVEDGFDVSLLQKFDEDRKKLLAQWKQENRDQDGRMSAELRKRRFYSEDPPVPPALCFGPKRYYATSSDVALALIQLDWRQTNRQLKEAFDRLLEQRPKRLVTPKKGRARAGGRGLASHQLNQSSAKRLLRHYEDRERAVEAVERAPMKPGQKRPYSDADALATAAAKSRAVLQAMERGGRFRAFADL